jgi:hypothetical protein
VSAVHAIQDSPHPPSCWFLSYSGRTWESGGIAPPFLSSALDKDELSASRSGCFTSMERAAGTYSIGGWVGPRAGLDSVEKRKILHCGNRTRTVQPSLPCSGSKSRCCSVPGRRRPERPVEGARWDQRTGSAGSACCPAQCQLASHGVRVLERCGCNMEAV